MPLNPSGQISLGGNVAGQSVNLELGRSATAMINLNDTDLRSLFGIVSGMIRLSDGYGKSSGASDGYFEGTQTLSPTQGGEVSRYTFATNTASAPGVRLSPGAPKSSNNTAGVNTPAKSYFARGNTGTPNPYSGATAYDGGYQIDGIVFSSQTYFDSAATLVQPRFSICANANSETRGYFGGGAISPWPTNYPQIDGITFATDSQYDVAAGLIDYQNVSKQHVQSATRGYFSGAINSPSRVMPATMTRLAFDTEVYAEVGASLVQARLSSGGLHSSTRGYFLGGSYPPSAPAATTQIDGITFATETQYDAAASMTAGMTSPVSMIQGGYGIHSNASPTGISQSDKFTFSTETIENIGAAAGGIAYAGLTARFSGTQNSSF
jgi:hypothetical protein